MLICKYKKITQVTFAGRKRPISEKIIKFTEKGYKKTDFIFHTVFQSNSYTLRFQHVSTNLY